MDQVTGDKVRFLSMEIAARGTLGHDAGTMQAKERAKRGVFFGHSLLTLKREAGFERQSCTHQEMILCVLSSSTERR